MKRKMQNVLAQHSTGDIAYLCGKCGVEVNKDAVICHRCGAKLGNIRCPFCNYTGGIADFKNDTCPKCGRKDIQSGKKKRKSRTIHNSTYQLTNKKFWLLFILLISFLVIISIIIMYNFKLI